MKRLARIFCLAAGIAVFPNATGLAGPADAGGEESVTVEAPAVSGPRVTMTGDVVGAFFNEAIIVSTNEGYRPVRIREEHWDLGLQPGDTIRIRGILAENENLRGIVHAQQIMKLGEAEKKPPNLRLTRIDDIRLKDVENRLVAVRGRIAEATPRYLELADGDATIRVDLRPDDNKDDLWSGMDVIVIGTVSSSPLGNVIDPIAMAETVRVRRKGEPRSVLKVRETLREKPLGKMVRVEGRIALYTGGESALILHDGSENVILIEPARKYLSIEPEAGQLVHVVGTFDTVKRAAKEMAVLREARIDPPGMLLNEPLKD